MFLTMIQNLEQFFSKIFKADERKRNSEMDCSEYSIPVNTPLFTPQPHKHYAVLQIFSPSIVYSPSHAIFAEHKIHQALNLSWHWGFIIMTDDKHDNHKL